MTFAFSFDASACSGCKACQAACKDKNNLPLGVIWRRNYEVGGGEWAHTGDAWTSTIYAYYLSIACNHCVHPKCAGVCPVNAYTVRDDGIVLLDSSKCIGCGYCAWACPYGAPQYDRTTGTMTKCDLCYDNIDAGLSPACVSACPMRVLDLAEQSKLEAGGHRYQAVFPMPATSRTEPRIYIKPHPAAELAAQEPQVLNQEEYAPQRKHLSSWAAREEIPLLVFTLSSQMAAGISWTLGIMLLLGIPFSRLIYMAMGVILGLGLVVSFLHLGSPKNAWRVFCNLRKSWLSREILVAIIFILLWAVCSISFWFSPNITTGSGLVIGLTALASAALVSSMAEVYRLRMVPAWNTWRTKASFFLSAIILGLLSTGTGSFITGTSIINLTHLLHAIGAGTLLAFSIELVLTLSNKDRAVPAVDTIRGLLTVICFLGAFLLLLVPVQVGISIVVLLLFLALFEEIVGRWLFYTWRNPSM